MKFSRETGCKNFDEDLLFFLKVDYEKIIGYSEMALAFRQ